MTAERVAEVFTRHADWDRWRAADLRREAEYTAWLIEQCPACQEGGEGDLCRVHVGRVS